MFSFRKIKDTSQAVSTYFIQALRFGLVYPAPHALSTLAKEGQKDLHLKVMGDALARFLQNSGPVLTKFGQILATRSDLLPAPLCQRLELLYSKQEPMSEAQFRKAFKKAFPKSKIFKSFNKKALAVGSVGQVHRATLQNGDDVIVKILRPDIENRIRRDVTALSTLTELFFSMPGLKKEKAMAGFFKKSFSDLAKAFKEEADLTNEARALDRFRKRFRKNKEIVVPKCYKEFSSKTGLVMERLEGEPLSEYRKRASHNPALAKKMAHLALKEILEQIFEDGHFHADPHGGNLFILPDGRLGLIDLGLTGEMTPKDRKNIGSAVQAFLSRDADKLIDALLGFGEVPADFNASAFKKDIQHVVSQNKDKVIERLKGSESSELNLESFVNELFKIAHKHHVFVPSSSTLLIKTIVTIEGVARSLDPEMNVATSALPILLRAAVNRWSGWNRLKSFFNPN